MTGQRFTRIPPLKQSAMAMAENVEREYDTMLRVRG
jgi:hypothetical protein